MAFVRGTARWGDPPTMNHGETSWDGGLDWGWRNHGLTLRLDHVDDEVSRGGKET